MGTKSFRVAVAFFVLTSMSFAAPNFKTVKANAYNGPEFAPGQVVVKFKSGIDTKGINSTAASNSLTILKSSDISHYTLVQVPSGKSVDDMVAALNKDPNVEYAEPNYIYHAFMTPNDTYYSPYQWDLPQIHMPAAWDQSTGSGVVVAVIDCGVAYENYGSYAKAPDLAGTNFVAGYDFVNNDSHPNDDEGHGTHVSGTIAQTTNNNLGCAGVAYNCSIMPVKVLNSQGNGTLTDIADGINWATSHGAKVINMSLGGPSGSSTLQSAIVNAYNAGVTIVCAAGNAGTSAPQYPAAYSQCISVSAVRYDRTIASYSSYGSTIDICAPGGDVTVDQNGDGYGDGILQNTFAAPNYSSFGYYFYEGTSMASPHVAGVAALLIAKAGGSLSPSQVRAALQNTADDLGASGWDQYYGYGEVNADAALQSISGGGSAPVANFSGSPTSGTAPLNVSFTDQSTNSPTSWSWNFGDGGTSTAQNPSHTYSSAGTYTVSLTATNAYGSNSNTKTNYISVTNPQQNPPVANFSGSPTSGTAPLAVSFTDLSSNAPTSWSWSFGDGGTSTAQNPSHTYSSAGTYTVSLTATNAYGSNTNTKTNYISVTNPSSNSMHVSSIVVTRTTSRRRCRGYGTITIVDGSGTPLAGATVYVTATGPTGGTGSAATGSDGSVTFQTSQTRRNCGLEYCFEVTNVTYSGYTYDQASNAMTKVCESGTVFSDNPNTDQATQIGGADLPYSFGLDQNYPNPFNPTTQISFEIPQAAHVTLEVFNMAGQKVATLADENMTAGAHTVTWNASDNSSGVYLYRLQAGNQIDSRKMILLK
ncbi:MAG TPA: S8 family serine peptidase [candidate division Zixibacteria bacterium]|nr:S8 family serine peptidase [candidate division Zixibacteria bacterium]